MVTLSTIAERYAAAGQAHVLDYYDDLSPSEQEALLTQLDAIPVEQLGTLFRQAQSSGENAKITPFSGTIGRTSDPQLVADCRAIGMEAIRKGQVAALVLAGGQGTRLGFSGPKGMFDMGLPSGRTLFQLIAERLVKLQQLAQAEQPLPLYVMTSPLNHDETQAYFAQHANFGLTDVVFFPQGMLPCLTTNDGKMILEDRHRVAMAPDGNGGLYPSLAPFLPNLRKRGIDYLHAFSIDNCLTKPADPVFLGYCIRQHADCGNKVVWKADAHEKVGVVAEKDGRPCVVEYSEITSEMAERTDEDGYLVWGAANICNHFYTVDFLEHTILPNVGNLYHVAHKKIPYYDGQQTVTPTTHNNGIKLETFIFDVFPLSQNMAILDVDRAEEFAPVKNREGNDSPETARALLAQLGQKWLRAAGREDSVTEVAPCDSYAGEGLEE